MPPFPSPYRRFLKISAGLGVSGLVHIQVVMSVLGQSLIVPDNTLGTEASRVIQHAEGSPNELIIGGAQRAQNLFHSFDEFNVAPNRGAFFVSPDGVNNIFSRITGNNPSNILGTLGTQGNDANLFLLNPNGIIFGPTSSLDVGRSFAAVTSDAIQFGDRGLFSAAEPTAPSDLLTINPTAFLFGNRSPGSISNTSFIPSGPNTSSGFALGLRVPDGYSLILLGGDVTSDGSQFPLLNNGINAFGGRIEIGGLAEAGSVALEVENATTLSLSFPPNTARGNISLINGARIDTVGTEGGDIVIHGQNVEISGGSGLFAGIGSALGEPGSRGGNILVDVTDSIQLSGFGTAIENATRGDGNAGGIILQAGDRVSLMDGATLSTNSFSRGNAGPIIVRADNSVLIDGMSFSALPTRSGILSSLQPIPILTEERQTATERQAGRIRIETSDLILRNGGTIQSNVEAAATGQGGDIILLVNSARLDGGQIQTLLRGTESGGSAIAQGTAGDIKIDATGAVVIDGNTSASGLISAVGLGSIGNGGTITVNATSLSVLNGGTLEARTRGLGNSGNIRLQLDNRAEFDGTTPDGQAASGAYSRVDSSAIGNGGILSINAESLVLTNGAVLNAETSGRGNSGTIRLRINDAIEVRGATLDRQAVSDGQAVSGISNRVRGGIGNGGNIDVEAGAIAVTDGAVIDATTSGDGNAGRLRLRVDGRVEINGATSDGQRVSAIASVVDEGANGNGNNIDLTAESLAITNGARITAETFGNGQSGNIILNIESGVVADGTSFDGKFSSGVFSTVNPDAVGDGGDIRLTASTLDVINGAILNASTQGDGNAGGIEINLDTLSLQDGTITVRSLGDRLAGNLRVNARKIHLDDRARLSAETEGGEDGNIVLQNVEIINLQGNSGISASTIDGTAGRITLNLNQLPANRLQLSNSRIETAARGTGNAGGIRLNARSIAMTNDASISASTNSGQGGDIVLRDLETLELENSRISAQTRTGWAGKMDIIAANQILLSDGSLLSVEAEEISSDSSDSTASEIDNQPQETRNRVLRADASANSPPRVAGTLTLNTNALQVFESSTIKVSSPDGQAGNVVINVNDLLLSNGEISAETGRSAAQGEDSANVMLNTSDLLVLQSESLIAAQANAAANGGNITINAGDGFIVAMPNDNNDIIATAIEGNGGRINITTQRLFSLRENSGNFPALRTNQTNDMSVTSTLGTNGVIAVNDLGLDPVQAVTELPVETASPPLRQGCAPGGDRGRFTNVGQGGLPLSSGDVRGSDRAWEDISPPEHTTDQTIVEAQTWTINDQGQVRLQVEPKGKAYLRICQS